MNTWTHIQAIRCSAGKIVCIHVVADADRRTKTGTHRIVPVAEKLLPVIRRCLAAAPGDTPLFPIAAEDGGAKFGRTWLKKVKKLGKEITMHGFRHYATSEMENANVGRAIACAVLGHHDRRCSRRLLPWNHPGHVLTCRGCFTGRAGGIEGDADSSLAIPLPPVRTGCIFMAVSFACLMVVVENYHNRRGLTIF